VTIAELEALLERRFLDALKGSPEFDGYLPRVSFFEKGRETMNGASLEKWSPSDAEVRVTFEPAFNRETSRRGISEVGSAPSRQDQVAEPTPADFQPVSIRGEALSETVLRERR
jgi:hypothetical protein